jgi:hypothetical protein
VNISGYDNNFRPPMPLSGRVVQDGSDIVNSSFTWTVIICCNKLEEIFAMTSSVSTVLGLSEEDLEINHSSANDDSSWKIEYRITVIENTETFLTNLFSNLHSDEFMENIIVKIEADLRAEVGTFDSVWVSADYTDLASWHYPYNVTEWGEVAEICKNGTKQSPVDLPMHPGISQNLMNITIGVTSNLIASHGHSLK